MNKLTSPIDITLLRRFAKAKRLEPGEPLWEILSYIGQDTLEYLRDLRAHIDFVARHAEIWNVDGHEILFLPRTDPLRDDPSAGIDRYLESTGKSRSIAALIYPDRRGAGYGLSRHNDDPRYDFTRIENEPDVHFAHARGFIAKTSAVEIARVKQLLALARV
jgi:hypothetical protein